MRKERVRGGWGGREGRGRGGGEDPRIIPFLVPAESHRKGAWTTKTPDCKKTKSIIV